MGIEYIEKAVLPETSELTATGEIWRDMVRGIDRYIESATEKVVQERKLNWKENRESAEEKRQTLRHIVGLKDERTAPNLALKAAFQAWAETSESGFSSSAGCVGKGPGFRAFAVRWNVFRAVQGDGLILVPDGKCRAAIVALPDCDQTPEMLAGLAPGIPPQSQFARILAGQGCLVIAPYLIDRGNEHSGLPGVQSIRHPHREVLWRAAYQMGRTLAAYEVQKVLGAVDWLKTEGAPGCGIGVAGYGEGGMIAMYAAAFDTRIEAVAVSGYFQPRENLWQEPIYRNIWSFVRHFGDAEMAALIFPRPLVIEAGKYPAVSHTGETEASEGIAPGVLEKPPSGDVEREIDRARQLIEDMNPSAAEASPDFSGGLELFEPAADTFGSAEMLQAFLLKLNTGWISEARDDVPTSIDKELSDAVKDRSRSQYLQILEDTQHLMRESEFIRAEFWNKADTTSVKSFEQSVGWYKDYLWDEIIGRLPPPDRPMKPKSRQIYDTETCRAYEVMLDVYEDVFAYGILTVPKNLRDGERRPVVVCQHGLEGRPQDVADPDVEEDPYNRFAYKLAELGFVTFAPQNPYIGTNTFRQVLRRGQPAGLTLFSFIVRQHERILDWLAGLPIVDPERMAFYGLSYGGKTAMRVPQLLDRYCLSICSADYNEWIWKNMWIRHHFCYLYSSEYDMPEFDLGNTFNYAELSRLVFPRPFMVERGRIDDVAPDEWVAYEYAKTRKFYVEMGMADKTEIEFFDGPHTINGVGTYEFLQKHLHFEGPLGLVDVEKNGE